MHGVQNASTTVLERKAVLAHVKISQWTARRFDRDITNEVHKSHRMTDEAGRYNKCLIPPTSLKGITQAVNAARAYHIKQTMPWIDEGARLLPTARYLEYVNALRPMKEAFEQEVDAFCREYPELIEQGRVMLGTSFDRSEYPEPSSIKHKFAFDVVILPTPQADFRVDLGNETKAELESAVATRLQNALTNSMREPLQRAADMLTRMVERLKGYKPGTASRKAEGAFHASLVENVRDYVDLLYSFNLTGDAAITGIADRIKQELCLYDANELKDNKNIRAGVAHEAQSILDDITAYLA